MTDLIIDSFAGGGGASAGIEMALGRSLGWDRWHVARGLRADEPGRLSSKQPRARWKPWHPLAAAMVSKREVADFWDRQPFDLRLENVGGKTPRGNCDGCFLKSEENLAALCRDHPDRARWWADREEELALQIGKGSGVWFNQRRPMASLIDLVHDRGPGLFDTEGYLCQANDGECV